LAVLCLQIGVMEMVDKFLTKMYRTNPDFVVTVNAIA
jgi:hypothetical protein